MRKNGKVVRFYLKFRNNRLLGKLAYHLLKLNGAEIPLSVVIGENVFIPHYFGLIIHPNVTIGNNVILHQNVTIGRADDYYPIEDSKFRNIIIEDNVYIGAGAKIISKDEQLIVRKGTKVGANAVLLNSTGENETWVGIPARKIK